MNIKFYDLYFDEKSDTPVAVFKDIGNNLYFLNISPFLANKLYTGFLGKNSFSTIENIFTDILKRNRYKLIGLYLKQKPDGTYYGEILLNRNKQKIIYRINYEDMIYLSIIYEKELICDINCDIFTQNDSHHISYYLTELNNNLLN